MINLKDFVNLNVEEKYRCIEGNGAFLMERRKGNRQMVLYYFANMFCEVWKMELTDHHSALITDIKLFKSLEYLEPYLKEVNIDDLNF